MIREYVQKYLGHVQKYLEQIQRYFPMFHRFKTPNLLQFEATECGATALSIIMGYYKKFVSAEEIRIKCGVSRNGSKAINMIKAARHYGMTAQGAEVEDVADLEIEHFPLIAFWDFDHFVVIESIGEKYIYINDPAQGPRALDYETFNKSFTGVVILLKPGPDYIEDGIDPHQLPELKPFVQKYLWAFIFIAVIGVTSLIPALIQPATAKIFIDDILTRQLSDWLRPLLITMAGIGVVSLLISWLQETFLLRLNIRLSTWLIARFIWHVFNLPLSFFASRHSGDILLRVKSIYNLSQLISGGLSSALISCLVVVFYFFLMLVLSVKLTLIILLMTFMGLFITWFHKSYMFTFNQQVLQSMNNLTGIEIGGLRSIEAIKASGSENEFLNKRSSALARVMKDRQKLFGFGMSLGSSTQIASTIMSLSLICIASLMIMDGQLTLGTLIAFQVISGGFISPLLTLAGLTAKLQEAKTHLARLKDALNHPLALQTTICSKNHDIKISGEVSVKNITFGYSPLDAPTVSNVSLHIPHQGTFGIVGQSGSGKSTLALLIAGLYQATAGEIYIDNMSLWDMDQILRKRAIAFIDSDVGIFEGTLHNNLTLFQPGISTSLISKAVKNACLEDVMESVNGLQGYLTENGGNLSGGQRQRVEIARAIIQDARILILDEATSALDPILEVKVLENLRKLRCTVIIISHRLSSLKICDQIAVMNNGQLIAKGSHKKLLKTSSLYKQLVSHE